MDRHATRSYKRRQVDVTVRPLHAGSYIAVLVHDPLRRSPDQSAEYITDAAGFDDAMGAGLEIARALIDGQLH